MEEIFIQKPCDAGWKNMTPNSEGRFCDSCSLTVVDFTKMTNEEISAYFMKKAGERVCGHYRNDQISTPKLVRRRNRWGWLVTAITLVFGTSFISSCKKHVVSHTQGERAYDFAQTKKSSEQHAKDFHH